MTGFERFIEGGKRAAEKAKTLPVINPEELKHIVLADAPPTRNKETEPKIASIKSETFDDACNELTDVIALTIKNQLVPFSAIPRPLTKSFFEFMKGRAFVKRGYEYAAYPGDVDEWLKKLDCTERPQLL